MNAKKIISSAIVLSLISLQAFAADLASDPLSGDSASTASTEATTVTDTATDTTVTDTATDSTTDMNAAGKEVTILAPTGTVSNYTKVDCDKDFFIQNSCNECFDGGKKTTGEKITSLVDSWTNPNTDEQIIYKDEQTLPEFLNLGGDATKWMTNPEDSTKFWKFSDSLVWLDSKSGSGSQEFLLEGGKNITVYESDLGASYIMDSTDKKDGDVVGLLKFPLAYHNIDATGKESEKMNHVECVAYYAAAPVVATTPAPEAKEVTQVKTGPESFILISLALILTLVYFRVRRKA